MDEARRVMERLDRIEGLQRAQAPAGVLLAELRALLREGEAWVAAEPGAAARATAALAGCRARLGEGEEVAPRTAAEAFL
jgi:hypothetical protein